MTENRINLATARATAASCARYGQSHTPDTITALISGYVRLARDAGEITATTPERYQ